MRNGIITVAELVQRIRSLRGLALRLALYWHEDRWIVRLMDVHFGTSHGLPTWRKYTYRRFAFLTARTPGARLADWITVGSGELSGLEFLLPHLSDSVNWQQNTSQPGWALVPIRRPSITYTLSHPGFDGGSVHWRRWSHVRQQSAFPASVSSGAS